ncbi:hypothetical protein BDY17DRAFT_345794 [Neohortaea acidophila]|uniref:Uncharacterized protein n=1 Tax=Neohortaea acidophila TaxID=245834 RepID=A0A6A6PU13_9PEZI|nr:uncharacterized protein BDY17DRAFT_345794 [Neohortaea acidophila]KAF2483174.1 hypothetical protein BDY17DRAFT_345794 [Neohortaea acidophila]
MARKISGTAARHSNQPIEMRKPVQRASKPGTCKSTLQRLNSGIHLDEERDDEDLTPLEYARRYKLVANHRARNPLPAARASLSHDECSDEDTSCEHDNAVIGEKWAVDRGTAQFLASIIALTETSCMVEAGEDDGLANLRLTEPLLSTDPELELERLRRRQVATISSRGMKPFVLQPDKGQSFAWSPAEQQMQHRAIEAVNGEKLQIHSDTLKYIKDCMDLACSNEGNDFMSLPDQATVQVLQARSLSPPLLPMSPDLAPQMLEGTAGDMVFTSTPDDHTAIEAADLERQIMERESWSSPYTSPVIPSDPSLSTPLQGETLHRLKLDSPFLPAESPEVSPPGTMAVAVPATLSTLMPEADDDIRLEDLDEDLDDFIANVTMPFAEWVVQQTENEQLVEIDTTMRVKVPPVDQVTLSAPWKATQYGNDWFRNFIVNAMGKDISTRWSGVSKLERSLPWKAFPSRLGKIENDESLDETALTEYLSLFTFEDELDVTSLVPKKGGLRILDSEDSDYDELEAASIDVAEADPPMSVPHTQVRAIQPPPPNTLTVRSSAKPDAVRMDMQTLLKKRKLELEKAADLEHRAKRLEVDTTLDTSSRPDFGITTTRGPPPLTGLSSFMQLQGQRSSNTSNVSALPTPAPRPCAPLAVMVETQHDEPPADQTKRRQFAMPDIESLGATSIVVSVKFLQDRHVARAVQDRLPMVDFVERTNLGPAGDSRVMKYVQDEEADITISPSVGVVLTTVQKLKQRSLPGQGNFWGVRERISAVAPRYEQVIVLVSDSRHNGDGFDKQMAAQLDEKDAEALAELTMFGHQLGSDIEVYYIAGGDDALSTWIAAAISRHATRGVSLQDESSSERFLRVAGLNASAAQAILSEMRVLGSTWRGPGEEVVSDGLAAFVHMSSAERIERFGQLMGGERVLRRVSRCIDGGWKAAYARPEQRLGDVAAAEWM